MYTVTHVLSCHSSPFPSYPRSLSIHLSPPSHLLYHLCSCNRQDSSCALFHCLACSSLLILAHPSLQAWPPPPPCLEVWLTCLCPTTQPPCSQTQSVQSGPDVLRHTMPCHYTASPDSLHNHCFHLPGEGHGTRSHCDNTHTRWMITLNYSKKRTKSSPSHGDKRRVLELMIQVITNGPRADIPLGWIMEKLFRRRFRPSSQFKCDDPVSKDKFRECNLFSSTYLKCSVKAFHQEEGTFCNIANGDSLLWCPYWSYAHLNEMARLGKEAD